MILKISPALALIPALCFGEMASIAPAKPVHPKVLEQALPVLIDSDLQGVGAEALSAGSWLSENPDALLRGDEQGYRLLTRSGSSLAVSEKFGGMLERLNQYFGMAATELAHPLTHQELRAAILSPAGVSRIRELFDQALAGHTIHGGQVLIPEIGGEAVLGAEVAFHVIADATQPVLQEISKSSNDPQELSRIYARYPGEMKILDEGGALSRVLDNLPGWQARGVAQAKIDGILQQAVGGILESAADRNSIQADSQLSAIIQHDWSGRYVGLWHLHTPHFADDGWAATDDASLEDLELAVQHGQNLTIVFQPDGFDAYDLAPLAAAGTPDASLAKVIAYRSSAWQAHFQQAHQRIQAILP